MDAAIHESIRYLRCTEILFKQRFGKSRNEPTAFSFKAE